MEISEKIFEKLKELKIDFEVRNHVPFFTCEESGKFHKENKISGERAKNLFLRNKNGKKHFLLLLPHSKEYDKVRFKEITGEKCGFADDERLEKFLKTYSGAVSPFGLLFDENRKIEVYIDEALMNAQTLHFHPNRNDQSVEISPLNLEKFLTHLGYKINLVNF